MKKRKIILKTHTDTINAGEKLGGLISSKTILWLSGNLGSGKTTFTKGLAKGLSISEKYYITSPTYTLVNEYPGRLKLNHIDLYRIEDIFELEYIGLEDVLAEEYSVAAIEWPEILFENAFYSYDLKLDFSIKKDGSRKISMVSSGRNGGNLLEQFFATYI